MDGFSTHMRDLMSCTSMSLNNTARYAFFAGRRLYGVVDLDNPGTLVGREARQSKWDVIKCEWNGLDDERAVVASNNKIELVRIDGGSDITQEYSLRVHTRVLTDLTWHTLNRNILATSATDAFIYLWDVRDPRRPHAAFQAVAGAVKIAWNKVSGRYLASAHEGEVKLWDVRMSKSPVQYINAHISRIYDMEWSGDDENHLVTSSQDSCVKFWNIANTSKAENVIRLNPALAWKISYTPFGHGLLTLAVQSVVRGENRLILWNNNMSQAPVHTFYAADTILDLGWRHSSDTNRCQLVTWSKDTTFRMWNIDVELQEKCGLVVEEEDRGDEAEEDSPNCAEATEALYNDFSSKGSLSRKGSIGLSDTTGSYDKKKSNGKNSSNRLVFKPTAQLSIDDDDLDVLSSSSFSASPSYSSSASSKGNRFTKQFQSISAAGSSANSKQSIAHNSADKSDRFVSQQTGRSSDASSFTSNNTYDSQPQNSKPASDILLNGTVSAAQMNGGLNKPMNLHFEFSLINIDSSKLKVEAQDAAERIFRVSAHTCKSELVLSVKFPTNYPNQTAPTFSFLEGTTVDNVSRSNILAKLRHAAKQQTSRNRRCLEACLRQFEQCVEALDEKEKESLQSEQAVTTGSGSASVPAASNPTSNVNTAVAPASNSSTKTDSKESHNYNDHCVPFPRSSGARFCGDGHLVCFGMTRQYKVVVAVQRENQQDLRRDVQQADKEAEGKSKKGGKSQSVRMEQAKTPRALSALTMLKPRQSGTASGAKVGATSPNYNIGMMPMYGGGGANNPENFPYQTRVSRVRFSTQRSRYSTTSEDNAISVTGFNNYAFSEGGAIPTSSRSSVVMSTAGVATNAGAGVSSRAVVGLGMLPTFNISGGVPVLGGGVPSGPVPNSQPSRKRTLPSVPSSAKVTVYNCAALMPYSRLLAEMYIVQSSPAAANMSIEDICRYNGQMAAICDKAYLHQTWNILGAISNEDNGTDSLHPWAAHPFGRNLLSSLIHHHISSHDFQTAAVICAIFGSKVGKPSTGRKKSSLSECLQYERETAYDALNYSHIPGRHHRSNSDTKTEDLASITINHVRKLSLESHGTLTEDDLEKPSAATGEESDIRRLLDPAESELHDNLILFYSDILLRWRMLSKRTELTKGLSEVAKHQPDPHAYAEVSILCHTCGRHVKMGSRCTQCRTAALRCSVCRQPCQGLVVMCPRGCGHGGHVIHLSAWFRNHRLCPTGCGCSCEPSGEAAVLAY